MRILAVETSTSAASTALMEDGHLRCEYILNDGKKHSEKLINLIDMVLKSYGMKVKDVDAFAYSMGPGSFTGLRIGAAVIKGIAQATDRPIIGIPTLDGLAYNLWGRSGLICPILDAQRNMVYSSIYNYKGDQLVMLEDYRAIDIDNLIEKLDSFNDDVTFLGDGVSIFEDRLKKGLKNIYFAPAGSLFPRASSIASLAAFKYKRGDVMSYKDLSLNYIRKSQAEVEYAKKHKVVIQPMKAEDIKGVHEIETMSFTTPWSLEAFTSEINNELSKYVVAKIDGKIVGYGGMWSIIDEGHITNIAVHADYRGQGIGNAIVKSLIKIAKENNVARMTLEVRPTNIAAIDLYKKYGFEVAGLRKNYYFDTGEDALIMWKEV
jgi:tRNA threonylcarbamoyladenosine biosynthesis protein TsaB